MNSLRVEEDFPDDTRVPRIFAEDIVNVRSFKSVVSHQLTLIGGWRNETKLGGVEVHSPESQTEQLHLPAGFDVSMSASNLTGPQIQLP
jgi:hypothetical protein